MEWKGLVDWSPQHLGFQNIPIPVKVEDHLGGLFLCRDPPGMDLGRAVHGDMQVFKRKIKARRSCPGIVRWRGKNEFRLKIVMTCDDNCQIKHSHYARCPNQNS